MEGSVRLGTCCSLAERGLFDHVTSPERPPNLSLLALPPSPRLSPSLPSDRHFPSNRQVSPLVAPKPYRLSPDIRRSLNSLTDSQVRTALRRLQPHMARATHSPLLVKFSSGLHRHYRRGLTVYWTIMFYLFPFAFDVLLSMIHFPV